MLWKLFNAPQPQPAAARSTSSQSTLKKTSPLYTCISRHSMRPNYLTKLVLSWCMYACPDRFIFHEKKNKNNNNKTICKLPIYTQGIYVEGYTVFAFLFVCSCVHHVRGIYKFFTELRESFSSGVPLIRRHSYLDHMYPGGSAFIP